MLGARHPNFCWLNMIILYQNLVIQHATLFKPSIKHFVITVKLLAKRIDIFCQVWGGAVHFRAYGILYLNVVHWSVGRWMDQWGLTEDLQLVRLAHHFSCLVQLQNTENKAVTASSVAFICPSACKSSLFYLKSTSMEHPNHNLL